MIYGYAFAESADVLFPSHVGDIRDDAKPCFIPEDERRAFRLWGVAVFKSCEEDNGPLHVTSGTIGSFAWRRGANARVGEDFPSRSVPGPVIGP